MNLPIKRVILFRLKDGKYLAENEEEITTEFLLKHNHTIYTLADDSIFGYLEIDNRAGGWKTVAEMMPEPYKRIELLHGKIVCTYFHNKQVMIPSDSDLFQGFALKLTPKLKWRYAD